jgi:hypothetical protein
MKIFQCILYGIIIGRWILAVKDRLTPGKTPGRYVIVAMHSMREEFILVGRCATSSRAQELAQIIEDETNEYITIIYDCYNKDDLNELQGKIESRILQSYSNNPDDQRILEDVSDMCDVGDM